MNIGTRKWLSAKQKVQAFAFNYYLQASNFQIIIS
jgi:hypothetical protein